MDWSKISWTEKVEIINHLGVAVAKELLSDKEKLNQLTQILGQAIGQEIAKAVIAGSTKESK